jgi:predicted alpha/beta-fold hydrolase
MVVSIFTCVRGCTSETPSVYYIVNEKNSDIVHRLNAIKYFAPAWWATYPLAQTFMLEFLYSVVNVFKASRVERQCVVTDDMQTLPLDWINVHDTARAIICIFPGLGGHTDACYVKPWHDLSKKMGYSVVVINIRGFIKDCPMNKYAKRYPTYLDIRDMKIAMDAIHERFPTVPKIGVGYSAGGNHLIGYAYHYGLLKGCVNVACGNDIMKCRYFTGDCYLGRCLTIGPRVICRNNRHLQFYQNMTACSYLEEIDHYYALQEGHMDVASYYAACSTHTMFKDLKVPTLCVMSEDDPLLQNGHKEDYISFAENNDHVISVITKRGGHCSWIQNDLKSWVSQLIIEYIEALLCLDSPRGL